MRLNNVLKLVIAVAVTELAGVIGSFFTLPAIPTWYAGLAKPALNPPSWVFGPAWTTLYALMGIAAFLIWREYPTSTPSEVEGSAPQRKRQIKVALCIFDLQLFLNVIWSIIFFGLHGSTWLTINNLGWALVDIIVLWFAIFWTIIVFKRISRPAAYLLLPYILWVTFAGYLNYAIWVMN